MNRPGARLHALTVALCAATLLTSASMPSAAAAAVAARNASLPASRADGAALTAQQSHAGLAGSWARNDERSDRSYWMREYPGMKLEVSIEGDRIEVRQSLGNVRNGEATPGSGSEFQTYTLVADGETRELQGPGAARRSVTAEWMGDNLRVQSVWHLSQNGRSVDLPMTEVWATVDGGARLEIRRDAQVPGGETRSTTNVFDRVR